MSRTNTDSSLYVERRLGTLISLVGFDGDHPWSPVEWSNNEVSDGGVGDGQVTQDSRHRRRDPRLIYTVILQ